MPSKWTGGNRIRWRARVKIDQLSYYLGSYPTREEAEKAEEEFRQKNRQMIDFIRVDHSRKSREAWARRIRSALIQNATSQS